MVSDKILMMIEEPITSEAGMSNNNFFLPFINPQLQPFQYTTFVMLDFLHGAALFFYSQVDSNFKVYYNRIKVFSSMQYSNISGELTWSMVLVHFTIAPIGCVSSNDSFKSLNSTSALVNDSSYTEKYNTHCIYVEIKACGCIDTL